MTVGGVNAIGPALAVVELASRDGGAAIDRFLREGGSLGEINRASEALHGWAGSAERRRVVAASRDLPWSAAERRLHAILRRARITGWVANLRVELGGSVYLLDVGFRKAKLALEADGYEFHSSLAAFERDRQRQNALVSAGWAVLRFTWNMLDDPAAVARVVRETIMLRS